MFCVLISLIDLGVTHMVIMICRYLEKTVTVGRWIFLTEVKIFRNHMPFIVPVWSYKTFFLTRFVMHSTTFRVLKVHFTTFMAYCLTGVLSKPSLLKPSLRWLCTFIIDHLSSPMGLGMSSVEDYFWDNPILALLCTYLGCDKWDLSVFLKIRYTLMNPCGEICRVCRDLDIW